jgi:hypothetical protein
VLVRVCHCIRSKQSRRDATRWPELSTGSQIGAVGEGWCFLIDDVSYCAVIAFLLLMRIKPLDSRRNATVMLERMREG